MAFSLPKSAAAYTLEPAVPHGTGNRGGFRVASIVAPWLFLFASVCGSCQQTRGGPPQNKDSQVAVGDQALFEIRAKLGPFTAQQRAQAVNGKLALLVKNLSVKPEDITADVDDASTDIMVGDVILTTVTDADATAAGIPRAALASEYVRRIRVAVARVRSEYSYKTLLLGALYALLATVIFVSILVALKRYAPRLYAAIERRRGTSIRTLRIQSLELLSAARITELLVQAAGLLRFVLTLVLFYFYIPLVFSFFPWTRTFGTRILDYVLSPVTAGWHAFVAYIPSLLIVLIIVFFSHIATRLSRFVFRELERGTISWPGFYPEWAMPTYKIVQLLILAFALVVMFPYLPGSDSPAFKGISIFLGVLFSLGSSSAVANVIAGVILTYTRAFRVGDRVKIAETVGDVTGKTLLATHIKTIKNVSITIPNSLVLGSHITNYSGSSEEKPLILHTSVTIGYDAPWREVHKLLIGAAATTEGILRDPAPFVLQTSLDDFYVSYQINGYTDQPSRMAVIYSDLHQNIQDKFNEAGVEIMSPHYHAVRDGNVTAIPESYLPADYIPTAFRIFRSDKKGKPGRDNVGANGVPPEAPSQ